MYLRLEGCFCFGESPSVLVARTKLSAPARAPKLQIKIKNSLPNGVPILYINHHATLATVATFTRAPHRCKKPNGDWYKLWKSDGSASGFYLAELKCPHSYYDDNHYCAMEFRCYLDDSDPNDPNAFSYTLYDDC